MPIKETTFGVIITSRDFFNPDLALLGRKKLLNKLDGMNFRYVILKENETPNGAVETFADAEKCAELFRSHRNEIDGIIVSLPNFGNEVAVATAIDLSGLNVPVLIHAFEDDLEKMDIENRRDAFCGKISLCNNLYQRNIKYTNTSKHVCTIDSKLFEDDLKYFSRVCSVVKGLSHARVAAIGTRPDPFHTVRFSEKLLQAHGITTCTVDLSEIIFSALKMSVTDDVKRRVDEIKRYGDVPKDVDEENIIKEAKLSLVIENWLVEHKCDASAVQCWNSIQNNYGTATCLAMSMMTEKGMPSACETDVLGALSMYALYLASGEPAGYLDWNNNYMEEPDKCVCLHCSNFPKSFIGKDFEISHLDLLGETLGKDKCFGACKATIAPGFMTFCKISTDDKNGRMKCYVGEGKFTNDPVDTKGGVAVCKINNLQELMHYICDNGFEHHISMNRSKSSLVLKEAFEKYLGWETYRHC